MVRVSPDWTRPEGRGTPEAGAIGGVDWGGTCKGADGPPNREAEYY